MAMPRPKAEAGLPLAPPHADILLGEISALRDRIDAEIIRTVDRLAETIPGVPKQALRQMITKGSECLCAVFQRMNMTYPEG